jgi:synaptic vesicle membrane protein VAT-1
MRSIWITKKGGADVLQVRQAPDPTPAPGYLRIRVRASGLNFADILARLGLYEAAPKLPCVMGYEVSGVVDGMGTEIGGFADGDRVLAMTMFRGHSDVVCVPTACVVKIPDGMSFETAAALPLNYLTAHVMLVRVAAVRRDETILVHAAAGGVGTALLQLSKAIGGVRVIGTCSASKHEALRRNGCWQAIDYRTQDYVIETRRR